MIKKGKASIIFENVFLKAASSISGPLESEGPLEEYLDDYYDNLHCNQENWEKAEMQLMKDAINLALMKAKLSVSEIDCVFAGDLNNQIAIANYVMRDYKIPYIGLYGACSTSTLSLITGATFLEAGFGKNVLCVTSSHNATSERQFRYPTEYGGQKPITMTSTVTGSGAGLLTKEKTNIQLTKATIGTIYDANFTDSLDMGRAMAPAAAMTLKTHLEDFNAKVDDYDLILTGDLSKYGSETMKKILEEFNFILSNNFNDCGLLIYDITKQPVIAGGSGCASAALVTFGYVYKELLKGNLNKVLIIATGALHNPITIAQKESIPGIAHAIVFERVK